MIFCSAIGFLGGAAAWGGAVALGHDVKQVCRRHMRSRSVKSQRTTLGFDERIEHVTEETEVLRWQ
jgi:hypothetical protein